MIYIACYILKMYISSSMSWMTWVKTFICSIKGIVCVTMGAALWVSRVVGTETLYPVGYSWWPCFVHVICHLDSIILFEILFPTTLPLLSLSYRWLFLGLWCFDFCLLTYRQDLQKNILMRAFPSCTEFVWRTSRVYLLFASARYELPWVVHGSSVYIYSGNN